MRLHSGSIKEKIMEALWHHEQLPYHALNLLGCDYEWAKDCTQQLIRGGYVGLIKAPNVKCLYLTPSGQQEYIQFCERTGKEYRSIQRVPIVYHPPKAARVGQINEIALMMRRLNQLSKFRSSRTIKANLEKTAARSSDNLKYSRFAGMFIQQEVGSITIYHFGKHNVQLNYNGEKSACYHTQTHYKYTNNGRSRISHNMLILGYGTAPALEILNYSDKLEVTENGKRLIVKTKHFNLGDFNRVFDSIWYLPLVWETRYYIAMMTVPDWMNRVREYGVRRFRRECEVISLLDIRLVLWQGGKVKLRNCRKPVQFVCWWWQRPLVEAYFPEQAADSNTVFDVVGADELVAWVKSWDEFRR